MYKRQDLYEAASIDGASAWQKFKSITVPMLMPAFTVVFFLTLSGSFKKLDENLALTEGNFGTRMLSLQILLSTRENTPPNYEMCIRDSLCGAYRNGYPGLQGQHSDK